MVRFNVEVVDEETKHRLKYVVNQLVEKECVEKLKKEFIDYASTKGYTLSKDFDISESVSIMNSDNGIYYLVINSYEEIELNNDTCIDEFTCFILSKEAYSGK